MGVGGWVVYCIGLCIAIRLYSSANLCIARVAGERIITQLAVSTRRTTSTTVCVAITNAIPIHTRNIDLLTSRTGHTDGCTLQRVFITPTSTRTERGCGRTRSIPTSVTGGALGG